MLGQIRRHQKWLWVIVAGATIISFVIFMDPNYGRRGNAAPELKDFGYINGRPITREEFYDALAEAKLGFRFTTGRWPEEDETSRQLFNPDRQLPDRLLQVEKLKELKIHASDAAVADWIANVFRDRDHEGFRMEVYQDFVKRILPQVGLAEGDLQRFARHQIGFQQLYELGGLAGSLVTPREAEALFRRENEEVAAEIVLFSASNHLASVPINAEAVGQFFTNNMSRYRIPERVQVGYVRFDVTNFLAEADQELAQITNLTERLEESYARLGADFFRDADDKVLSKEAAFQKMKDDERRSRAFTSARRKATDFLQELYGLYEKEPNKPDNLDRLAAATGIQSAVTEPFTRFDPPESLKAPASFGEVAFALSPEEPLASEPLVGEDAVYVIAFGKRIPSELPPFEILRDKVTEEYRRREAELAARRAGEVFYTTLTNGFAQNKSFQAVCLEANVLTTRLPPFSLASRSLPGWEGRVDLGVLKNVAATLAPGKTSEFVPTRDGGLVVHVTGRLPVDDAKLKSGLPAFTEQLRDERRRMAFAEWIRKEFELARITGLPQFRRPAAEPN